MASAFGWYGPLIDLRAASSHIGDFVQLLVFVHRSFPVQYKSSKGEHVSRTDIQVGDDTTPYFGVSLWQKDMGSKLSPGDVVLLLNFKIAKYGDVVEARTVQWSSLLCLVHPYQSLISKGVEELITGCCHVGTTTKDKLRRVIEWVQQSRSSICNIKLQCDQERKEKTNYCVNLKMRGIGGPLLCTGDLLSDVGEEDAAVAAESSRRETPPSTLSDLNNAPPVPDLTKLFQESYEHLNSSLAGTDHSWTSLTLKLCTALETANQLVQSTNSNVASLLDKVGELQKIVKRGNSAIAAARAVYVTSENDSGALIDNGRFKDSRS